MSTALEITDLSVSYDGVRAVRRVSLAVQSGEMVCLIGSNGAGKTSTMGAIMGVVPSTTLSIKLFGEEIGHLKPHQRVQQGLSLVPEGRGILTRMTVLENLQIGSYPARSTPVQVQADIERMFTTFPRLKERAHQLAGTMSGGEQQMLALARALMCHPRVLLLDEPSMGLSPIMVDTIFRVVEQVHRSGVTVLLVEQNAALALDIADRGYVMSSGTITLFGDANALAADQRVKEAYLGE
ncbi:ABC transporter ATP-binding protein [Hydrogenophaga intermedia]|jgi:branched-chain amino acid transport system ATP-binding protein|uniref:ABC transporter ATP-binding protein n=1 Tax=Hydrogenophaga intermedia TaxID=65786 RepID=UPI002042CDB4|nr:ABC transporter ATP-binding protein [Hydrogenophaga intermedia]MCM3563425.1 ABC transporter ATP-binding protein [Hydrogenophaga intermedia]